MARRAPPCAALLLGAALAAASAPALAADPSDGDPGEPAPEQASPAPTLHVGGALRFNLLVRTWDTTDAADQRDRGGDLAFDTLRLNVDATWRGLLLSAEYRLYGGYHMLHHGYVGYTFGPDLALHLGVHRVPFGLLPYASNNWFFNVGYYLGLEDDYDAGLKLIYTSGPWDLQIALYKNDEGSYSGASRDSARYSYDVVRLSAAEADALGVADAHAAGLGHDRETNQLNLRLAYRLDHDPGATTELGLSAQVGQLFNELTRAHGLHAAVGLHARSRLGPVGLDLAATVFTHEPDHTAASDLLARGAYDAPYLVPARGAVLIANLSYTFDVDAGPLERVLVYNDFSALIKDVTRPDGAAAPPTFQNVTGALFTFGPLLVYLDAALGRDHPWLAGNYGRALADGDPDASFEARFNLNVGWYF